MAKISLTDLASLANETSVVNAINNNNASLEAAIENTLSRDGTSPNEMEANLDMNNYRILNLPEAVDDSEPVTKAQMDVAIAASGGGGGGGGGVSDHGLLTGLGDDDHTQYLNNARGDARYQPLDSDLTALAALSTTSYGRSLLTQADAAASRTTLGLGTMAVETASNYLTTAAAASGYQPLDSDLTAIAALTTTSYGRAFLALADAAAARTALGLGTMATETASNYLTTASAASTYQPLDSDLTAIAALATTTFGRSLLTQADASAARTTLGLAIGTNVQAYDAELNAIAGLTSAADKLPYFTGSGTAALADFSSFGRTLVDDSSASAARSTLGLRDVLTADRTYYVRTDGSNSNDGLSNTSGGAFLTLQKACDVIGALDTSIYNIVVQVGDGTYTAGCTVYPLFGSGTLTIKGNNSTPANVFVSVTNNNCFTIKRGASVIIQDLKVGTTSSGHCLVIDANAYLTFANLNFAACAERHIHFNGVGSRVICTGSYTISGGAIMHVSMTNGPNSAYECYGKNLTFVGTPNFSTAFITVSTLCYANHAACGFPSGTFTGKRYDITDGGVLDVGGAGTSYFPGTVAGTGTNFGASPWGLYK